MNINLKERYQQLIQQRNKADIYFRERYWVDPEENKQKARDKIASIMQELDKLDKETYPWLQQYDFTMEDGRKELYVEFIPETFDNLAERIDIIQADGWVLKEFIRVDGKEYGYFKRVKEDDNL